MRTTLCALLLAQLLRLSFGKAANSGFLRRRILRSIASCPLTLAVAVWMLRCLWAAVVVVVATVAAAVSLPRPLAMAKVMVNLRLRSDKEKP